MSGWVKIHRRILKHNLWTDKPFAKGQAWIDIVLMADYSEERKRGCLKTSESKLMMKWGWSRKKVQYFLEYLERENMISRTTSKKGTIIFVTNYEMYQLNDTKDKKMNKNKFSKNTNSKNKFNNFESRNYDFDSLERQLLENS